MVRKTNLFVTTRIFACCLGFALSLASLSPLEAKVLAKVNGADITDTDLKAAMEDLGATLPQELEGKARDSYVLDYLIDTRLVAKKAEDDKVAATEEFTKRMAFYKDKVLMEILLGKIAKEASTEDNIKKTYDTAAKAQKPEIEIRARHILLPTEEEAKAALARVKAGEDFAKVATELSKDPGSEGGDLGYFTKERMVPEFSDAAFKMKVGDISQPVKSQFGWHVIKVEDSRTKPFPTLDAVKDQVSRYVVQKAQSEMILKLRDGAKIERMEEPAAAPTPAEPKKP